MSEIIKVDFEKQTVSARELHAEIGTTERFQSWFDRQLQYGFIEGVDYTGVKSFAPVNNGGTQTLQDYSISVEMAKQICMVQKTDRAKEVRLYLIELEKAWNTPELIMARGLQAARMVIMEKDRQISEMKPKVLFAEAVTASEGTILIRELAKLLKQNGVDIGEKRLYKWMRKNSYICQNNTEPTQRAMDLGLFSRLERTVQRADNKPLLTFTTKVTGKGQEYFINRLKKEAALCS